MTKDNERYTDECTFKFASLNRPVEKKLLRLSLVPEGPKSFL